MKHCPPQNTGNFLTSQGTVDKPDYNGNSMLWNYFPLQAGFDSYSNWNVTNQPPTVSSQTPQTSLNTI